MDTNEITNKELKEFTAKLVDAANIVGWDIAAKEDEGDVAYIIIGPANKLEEVCSILGIFGDFKKESLN